MSRSATFLCLLSCALVLILNACGSNEDSSAPTTTLVAPLQTSTAGVTTTVGASEGEDEDQDEHGKDEDKHDGPKDKRHGHGNAYGHVKKDD
jgi:hypothetical protein